MSAIASFRQINTGYTLTFPVQGSYTLQKLRILWGEQSNIDYQWFCFTDNNGQVIPEEGFVSDLIKINPKRKHKPKLKISVEELRPIKVHIEGFPQLSESFPVTLSTSIVEFKQQICEKLVLPERLMALRSANGTIEDQGSLADHGMLEGSEIIADFFYIIQVEQAGSGKITTVNCFASDSDTVLYNHSRNFSEQRLLMDEKILQNDSRVVDILKDFGGLYWMEWEVQLDLQITVTVTYPRWCEKIRKCTVTRHVWLLDTLQSLFSRECKPETRFLSNGKIHPSHYTFADAGILDRGSIVIGKFLILKVRALSTIIHSVIIADTDSVAELREKIQNFESKQFFHMTFNERILAPDHCMLKTLNLKNNSMILVQSKVVQHLICYDKDYNIGLQDEHISGRQLLEEVSGIISTPLNRFTCFKCQCGQILTSNKEEAHNYLCTQEPRCLTVVRQMKLTLIDEAKNSNVLIKPVETRLWEIINEVTGEDTTSLLLTHNENILDNSKRLHDLFGMVSEVLLTVRSVITPAPNMDLVFHRGTLKKRASSIAEKIKNYYRRSTTETPDEDINESVKIIDHKITSNITRLCERDCMKTQKNFPKLTLNYDSTEEDITELRALMYEMFLDETEYEVILSMSNSSIDSNILGQDKGSRGAEEKKESNCDIEDDFKSGNISRRSEGVQTNDSDSSISENENYLSSKSSISESNQEDKGYSLLHSAVQCGNKKMTEELVAIKACINARDATGRTPLHIASSFNHVELMEILIKHGSEINAYDNNGATALHVAVTENCKEAVQLLIARKANIEAKMKDGMLPLLLAVKDNRHEIVDLLIDGGANIEGKSSSGVTPLYKAVQMNEVGMIYKLLYYGANPNTKLNSGTTALFRAVQNNLTNIVEILLEGGANIHTCMENGANVLHFAARMNDCHLTELLIDKGADINGITIACGSPLHIAVQHDLSDIVKVLISKGANVNLAWLDGTTPMHVACHNRRLEMAQLLVENNGEINVAKYNGCTPLMIAVKENDIKMVRYLIENNADINFSTSDCPSALDTAENLNFPEIAEIIRKKGGRHRSSINACFVQ